MNPRDTLLNQVLNKVSQTFQQRIQPPQNFAQNAVKFGSQAMQAITNPVGFGIRQAVKVSPQVFGTYERIAQSPQVRPLTQAIGNAPLTGFTPVGQAMQNAGIPQPTVGGYFTNQIYNPLKNTTQSLNSGDLFNAGLSGVQAGFNATPAGLTMNMLGGAAAGTARSIRTGQPLAQSIKQAVETPTSISSEGLGVTNPLLAFAGDIALMNPKGSLKTLSKVKLNSLTNQAGKVKLGTTLGQASKGKIPTRVLTAPIRETLSPAQRVLQVPTEALKDQAKGLVSSGKSIAQSVNPTDPYFNVARLSVGKKAKTLIKQTVENVKPNIESVVGAKLSNKEAINLANNSSKVLHSTVSRSETLAWEAKMFKARQLLAQQGKDGTVTKEFVDNLIAIKSQGTDIARKLQSLGMTADPQTVTAKQAILEAVLKVNQNTDDILKAAQGIDFNDLNQATTFYRQFVAPKKTEWLDLLRYNSMLSSPNTHIINASSNYQGTGIVAPIEKTILGGVDFLKSTVMRQPRQYAAGEGAAYAKGYYSNIRQASHRFADVMRGIRMNENPDLRVIPLTTGGTARKVENVLSFPLKVLEATDQFFTTLTAGGVEQSLKYRASKGISVRNPEMLAKQEAAMRLFRGEPNPEGQGYVLGLLDSGANAVMMLRNSENPVVSTLAKFTLPFVRTPTNILKQGVEYTPLGLSTLVGATNKTEQFTKALMGTSIGIGVATLLSSDRLTWAEPTDATQRNAFRAAGLQPYSVKIGDKWVSYAKLHPAIAFNLAFVSALRDAEKNQRLSEDQVDTALNALSKWVGFFADQSYVKNIGDFVASTKGDIEGPARYFSNYPQQLIPFRALMGWVARLTDPNQRQVDANGAFLEKQLSQLATQIPLVSQMTPARQDSFGVPVPNQNRVINAFSPVKVTTENPAMKQEFDRVQAESQSRKYTADIEKMITEAEKKSLVTPEQALNGGPVLSGVTTSGTTTGVAKGLATVPTTVQSQYTKILEGIAQIPDPKYQTQLQGQADKLKAKYPALANLGWITDADGAPKIGDLTKAAKQQRSAELSLATSQYNLDIDRAKRNGDFTSYVGLVKKQLDSLVEYQKSLDPTTDKKEIVDIQNKIEDLATQANKYSKQGGFKKGKKPAKIKITGSLKAAPKAKTTKLRAKNIKLFKVKPAKEKKAKAFKVRPLKA